VRGVGIMHGVVEKVIFLEGKRSCSGNTTDRSMLIGIPNE